MSAGEAADRSRAAQHSARAARDDIYRVVSLLWQLERFFDPSPHAAPQDYRVEADLPPRLPPTGVRAGERPDGAGAPAWMEAPPRRIERGGQSPVTIAWVEPAELGVPEPLPGRDAVPPGLAPSSFVPVGAAGPGEPAAAAGWVPPPVAAVVQATGAPHAPAPRQPPRPPAASGSLSSPAGGGVEGVLPDGGAPRRDSLGFVPLEEARVAPAPAGIPGPGPAGSRPSGRSDAGSEDGAPSPGVFPDGPREAGTPPSPGRARVWVPDPGEAAPSPAVVAGGEGTVIAGGAPAGAGGRVGTRPGAAASPPAERGAERTPSEPVEAGRTESRAAAVPRAAPARRAVGDAPAPPRAVLLEAGGVVPSQADLARPMPSPADAAGGVARADDRADDWTDDWGDDWDDPGDGAAASGGSGPVEVTVRRRGSSAGALGRTEARRLEEELRRRFLDRPGRMP